MSEPPSRPHAGRRALYSAGLGLLGMLFFVGIGRPMPGDLAIFALAWIAGIAQVFGQGWLLWCTVTAGQQPGERRELGLAWLAWGLILFLAFATRD